MIREFRAGLLNVKVYESRLQMGLQAADAAANRIEELLTEKDEINILFAAAPSQNEFLESLKSKTHLSWDRINAFHMDEYIGLEPDAPQGFGNFLKSRVFDELPFRSVHYLNGNAQNPEEECRRYTKLLQQYTVDIAFMGIGENGHLAFNDPPVADFKDPKTVKIVELDEICRQQQVNDGCFNQLNDVPLRALTLTLTCLLSVKYVFCIVPGTTKSQAIKNTIHGLIDEQCPSTILRTHQKAILFLDMESSDLLYQYAE